MIKSSPHLNFVFASIGVKSTIKDQNDRYLVLTVVMSLALSLCVTDYNECANNNGGCSHSCLNQPGNYSCGCPRGFRLDTNSKLCRGVFSFNVPTSPIINMV